MKQRGVLAYLMIILITLLGLVNFFAPFFTEYKTDPLITYAFIALASGIAGFKGVGSSLLSKITSPKEQSKEESRE